MPTCCRLFSGIIESWQWDSGSLCLPGLQAAGRMTSKQAVPVAATACRVGQIVISRPSRRVHILWQPVECSLCSLGITTPHET